MQLSFNLEEAEIFIPQGRIMNLKDKLGWNDIEIDQLDLKNDINVLQSIEPDKGFEEQEKLMMGRVSDKYEQQRRTNGFQDLVKKELDKVSLDSYLVKKTDMLSHLLPDLQDKILNNDKVKSKLEKLAQLKNLNKI
jgi:hypothetical protein